MELVSPANVSLLTDFYELTMAASYFEHGMEGQATFELFPRKLPRRRNFLLACGTEDAADFLENFSIDDDGIDYLRSLGVFRESFLEHLRELRFSGEVWAMREGELLFPDEPVMRVTAPVIEGQIMETFLLTCIGFQSLVASKAARVAIACGPRSFVDFSPRRDHGPDAALWAARASFIGGAVATSNVLAGQIYGIPLSGTMAHSYVMSFDREADAFRHFLKTFPKGTTLLIDTYDTVEGARRAAAVVRELGDEVQLRAVRLDSGDLAELAKEVRKVLDDAGLESVQIFASGDLDEYRIAELRAAGAPIDAYGVGTQLGTGGDVPALGMVYKLVADEAGPKMKRSTGKATLPGPKQVYRFEAGGKVQHDLMAMADEPPPEGGRPVLELLMQDGRRVREREALAVSKERAEAALASLPEELRALDEAEHPYEVRKSTELQRLATWQTPHA